MERRRPLGGLGRESPVVDQSALVEAEVEAGGIEGERPAEQRVEAGVDDPP
jgi:hypothetical protein